MKKACRSIREWLGAYADNELDQARADQVVRHLETCADCRHELDQILGLNRLAKSVEHPRLAEDYWDWQRARVWHGIRNAPRLRTPVFRPSFGWARLATVAAGAVVVLLVAITGWRAFLPKPGPAGPVGALPSRFKSTREAPAAATRGAQETAVASEEPEPAADVARARVEGRADEIREVPASEGRDAEKTEVGYAGKGAGATRTATVPKPTPTATRGAVHKWEPAAERREELAAAPPVGESEVLASSRKESRIVSGPVLLESPPLPEADALDTGTVLLNVKTDSAGQVLSAAVRRSSGSARLDSLAVRQIRQSRFKAAVRKNRKVPSSFQYPFRVQKKQVSPQEEGEQAPKQGQRQEQRKQKEERKSPEKSDQPAQNDQSERQDDKEQARPVKEKTKK
jgi:TonB family protein